MNPYTTAVIRWFLNQQIRAFLLLVIGDVIYGRVSILGESIGEDRYWPTNDMLQFSNHYPYLQGVFEMVIENDLSNLSFETWTNWYRGAMTK